jgi:hypothetical protein
MIEIEENFKYHSSTYEFDIKIDGEVRYWIKVNNNDVWMITRVEYRNRISRYLIMGCVKTKNQEEVIKWCEEDFRSGNYSKAWDEYMTMQVLNS